MFRSCAVGMLTMALCQGCVSSSRESPQAAVEVASTAKETAELVQEQNACAVRLIEEGQLHEAEQALMQALAKDASHGPARNNLGQVYYFRSEMHWAAREFKIAAALLPDRPEPRNNLGLVCEAVGSLDQAVGWYAEACRLGGNRPEFLGNLARARLRRGDSPEEVRELLMELASKDQRPAWVQWAKGQLCRMASADERRAEN